MMPVTVQDRRAEHRRTIARQVEAAKRLQLVAQILGPAGCPAVIRAAELLTNQQDLPDVTGFTLSMLVDVVLGDKPSRTGV